MRYTMRQIQLWVDSIGDRNKTKTRDLAIVVRTAYGADEKGFKQFMKSLE